MSWTWVPDGLRTVDLQSVATETVPQAVGSLLENASSLGAVCAAVSFVNGASASLTRPLSPATAPLTLCVERIADDGKKASVSVDLLSGDAVRPGCLQLIVEEALCVLQTPKVVASPDFEIEGMRIASRMDLQGCWPKEELVSWSERGNLLLLQPYVFQQWHPNACGHHALHNACLLHALAGQLALGVVPLQSMRDALKDERAFVRRMLQNLRVMQEASLDGSACQPRSLRSCTMDELVLRELFSLRPELAQEVYVVEGVFGEGVGDIVEPLREVQGGQAGSVKALMLGSVSHWLAAAVANTPAGPVLLLADSFNKPFLADMPVAELAQQRTVADFPAFATSLRIEMPHYEEAPEEVLREVFRDGVPEWWKGRKKDEMYWRHPPEALRQRMYEMEIQAVYGYIASIQEILLGEPAPGASSSPTAKRVHGTAHLVVSNLGGKELASLDVPMNSTADDVKALLAPILDIPVQLQTLIPANGEWNFHLSLEESFELTLIARDDVVVDHVGSDLGSGGNKYYGGVLSKGGSIFALPCHAERVLRFEPQTSETRLIGSSLGSRNWKWCNSGFVTDSGIIYALPACVKSVLCIEPENDDVTCIEQSLDLHRALVVGCVRLSSGIAWGIPEWHTRFMRFDPATKKAEFLGPDIPAKGASGGALAKDGRNIFCPPFKTKQALRFDTETHEVEFFGPTFQGNEEYTGAVLNPADGTIYAIPRNATRVLRIDPAQAETGKKPGATFIGPDFEGSRKWSGAVLARDGRIYGIPRNASKVIRVNPETQDVDLVGSDLGSGGEKWIGGVVGADGHVYGMPFNAPHVLRIWIPAAVQRAAQCADVLTQG